MYIFRIVSALLVGFGVLYFSLTIERRQRQDRRMVALLTMALAAFGFSLFVLGFVLGARYGVEPGVLAVASI